MYFLAMNVTQKPFDNKQVRQALNHPIDPSVIIKQSYEGRRLPDEWAGRFQCDRLHFCAFAPPGSPLDQYTLSSLLRNLG
jgi:ABC-type transport system substrate-binding protein